MYFPVFVEGANLSMGDMHFSQVCLSVHVRNRCPVTCMLRMPITVTLQYSINIPMKDEALADDTRSCSQLVT